MNQRRIDSHTLLCSLRVLARHAPCGAAPGVREHAFQIACAPVLEPVATFSMFAHRSGLFIFWRISFRNGWILAKMNDISPLMPGCRKSSSLTAPCRTSARRHVPIAADLAHPGVFLAGKGVDDLR